MADSMFYRTLDNLRDVWRDIRESQVVRTLGLDMEQDAEETWREHMKLCLEAVGGQVSARARAAALGHDYLRLGENGRARFLKLLAREFDLDRSVVDAAVKRVAVADTPEERRSAEQDLRTALLPPRRELLTQLNGLPEGVKFLVDMRAELLPMAREDVDLAGLEQDLKRLLIAWFDVGFLELKRITWDAPAALLEKLIEYEAVHAIASWDDLKNRLELDRRCFGFFHPRMPGEPLIFVEVALVNGLAEGVTPLLTRAGDVADPRTADTAIFYSISNCQAGLAGISFGDFLIKRVVDQLKVEFPNLKTFATLSPIPGFRRWLDKVAAPNAEGEAPKSPEAAKARDHLGREGWQNDDMLRKELEPALKKLCARYLAEEKRRGTRALDPVAHFHLSNGARMERLNWMGDPSPKGIGQSAGLMINYLYDLKEIERNHEAYRGDGDIAMSGNFRKLVG